MVVPKGRPKPRPLKQVEHPAAALKSASDFGDLDNSSTNNKTPNPQQIKLPKLKPSKLKSEVAKVKEVLKNSQDTVRKAQEGMRGGEKSEGKCKGARCA